jgi:hypothetical protein
VNEAHAQRTALVALLALLALVGCDTSSNDRRAEGDCAAVVDYDGHRYQGHGELVRAPATTGRVETGTEPSCDDGTGEAGGGTVQVEELAALPMSRAVLVRGSLYVRSDRPFPEAARSWFRAPACASAGEIRLAGAWLAVDEAQEPRFDGDLRAPYRVQVRVADGPEDYRGTVVWIRADEDTRPTLEPEDVRTSLWEGGGLVARVRCEGGAFRATSLTSTPG